jgi:hypothetical protein
MGITDEIVQDITDFVSYSHYSLDFAVQYYGLMESNLKQKKACNPTKEKPI